MKLLLISDPPIHRPQQDLRDLHKGPRLGWAIISTVLLPIDAARDLATRASYQGAAFC